LFVHVGSKARLIRLLGIPLIAVSALFAAGGGPVVASASDGSTPYYVSLGDSLAQGVEPNQSGASVVTNHGYADDLYRIERAQIPQLKLAKLGCPAETTSSMRTGAGSICTYPDGSQLAQAVDFIQHHNVALVTIDIGANNIDGCLGNNTSITPAVGQCLLIGTLQAVADLTGAGLPTGQVGILPALRAVAPTTPIFGMNYYNPFLAAWVAGNQSLATQSVPFAVQFKTVLSNVYTPFGIPVADVFTAFQTTNFTNLPFVNLPVNVFLICAWTFNCTPPPVGPNIHPNDIGYFVIALTFAKTIGKL
jgi:lysophospholipase L1-like esterase